MIFLVMFRTSAPALIAKPLLCDLAFDGSLPVTCTGRSLSTGSALTSQEHIATWWQIMHLAFLPLLLLLVALLLWLGGTISNPCSRRSSCTSCHASPL